MELYYCKTCDDFRRTYLEGKKCPVCRDKLQYLPTLDMRDADEAPATKRPLTLQELIERKVEQIDKLLRSVIIDAADLGYAPLVHCLSESFLRLHDAKQEMFWKQREIGSAYIGVEPE